MATKLNVVNLQRDVRQLQKSPVESDEEDLEALRAAALASMTRPKPTIHRGSSGSDYYYESYEEDEYVETEVEVEVTDSEPEPMKKESMSDDFDDDCIAFHCDEVNEFASIDEGKPKKKKLVKQKKLVKRVVRKSRKVFVPRREKVSSQTPTKRSYGSFNTQARSKTPPSPLKYRSRSRSPRSRYRHSPHRERSISPYRYHRRQYSPYESDRLSPRRDLGPSDERQRSLHRLRHFDDRSSRSPNVRERSPSRWSYPKHRNRSPSPLREKDSISHRALRPLLGASSKNATEEYKARSRIEPQSSSYRSQQPSDPRHSNSRVRGESSPKTVSTTNGSPSSSEKQMSPTRGISHAVSSTTSPGVVESTQPLTEEKKVEKIIPVQASTEEDLSNAKKSSESQSCIDSSLKQQITQEKVRYHAEEITMVVSNSKNLPNKEDKIDPTNRPDPSLVVQETLLDPNNTGDLREQIEQLRRLRNQSPGLPALKTVELPLEIEISCDNESERPFKASNRIVKPPSKATVEKLPNESNIKARDNSRTDSSVTMGISKSKKKIDRDRSASKKRKRTVSSSSSSDSSEPPPKKAIKKKDKKVPRKKSKKVKKSKKSKIKRSRKRYSSSSSSSDSSDSSSDSEPRSRRRRRSNASRRRRSSDSSSSSDSSLERLKILKEKLKNEKLRKIRQKTSESSKQKLGSKSDSTVKEKSSKSSVKTDIPKNKLSKPSDKAEAVLDKKKKKTKPELKSIKKKKDKRKSSEVTVKPEKSKSKDLVKSDVASIKKRNK